MTISMTREALTAKLQSQIALAEEEDRRNAFSHKEKCKAAFAAYREKLRQALKWNYAEAMKHADDYEGVRLKLPSCDLLKAESIRRIAKLVSLDTRKSNFKISEGSDIFRALNWTPERLKEPSTVCELLRKQKGKP